MRCRWTCISTVSQDVLSDPKYSKYICGYVVDDGALFPGKTYRDTMVVDTEICGDNPVFSMVGMLSEFLF